MPAYTGAVTIETMNSINGELYAAYAKGYPILTQFLQQQPMIHYARNTLVRLFLETDSTDLFFVDSDVGFPIGTLTRLAEYPVDIVGCSYPFRNDSGLFPCRFIEERAELWANPETNLLEVAGLSAGCLRISRSCIEKLISLHPELEYMDMENFKTYALFDFPRRNGVFLGEDYAFCELARDAGFKIWLDPEVDMTHTGTKVFSGRIGNWLRNRNESVSLEQAMANIEAFVARQA